jgi:hypothetical protein
LQVLMYNKFMIRKQIELFAQYAGLATVTVEWLSLFLYYLKMPAYWGNKYPISYFDTLPQTRLIYSFCYVLASIFFWIFVRHHLSKQYKTPIRIFEVSMVAFIGIALIPFDPQNTLSHITHVTLGYISAFAFGLGMYLTAKNAQNKIVYRVTVLAIVSSAIFLTIFASLSRESNLLFAFEACSWLVVQLWIIWITHYIYHTTKIKKNILTH